MVFEAQGGLVLAVVGDHRIIGARGLGVRSEFQAVLPAVEDRRPRGPAWIQHEVARGKRDRLVREALGTVPREAFLPERLAEFAYDDTPLPIGQEQTISQPYVVALMAEALELQPGDKALEIGAGSGYAAAVLSRIA